MTKYILKKKWHPSQVEEVGHVFKEDEFNKIGYRTKVLDGEVYLSVVDSHEISLLVDAGYLEQSAEEALKRLMS